MLVTILSVTSHRQDIAAGFVQHPHVFLAVTFEPSYLQHATQIVVMTVLADGSVSNIQLVGSAARSMDNATLETLKGWKFKPAMCGTEPVVSDIHVVVSFRLGP